MALAVLRDLRDVKALTTAVEKGYFAENPLLILRWNAPVVNEKVDPAAVPNPAQVARLLAAVAHQSKRGGRGRHLEAFFGRMYYAAMRSAEVIRRRITRPVRIRPSTSTGRPARR